MNTQISISDAHARAVGKGLLDKSWPAADWRHPEHCIATLYMIRERTDLSLATALPSVIQWYNLAQGCQNTDTSGYHHTMTMFYLSEIQKFACRTMHLSLGQACDALLKSDIGNKDYVFRFWSREEILAPAARLGFVPSNLTNVDWSPEVRAVLPQSV